MTGALIALALALVFGGIGVALIIVAQVSKKKAQAAQAWPVAEGIINSIEVREKRSYDSQNRRTNISYEPIVEYSYSVEGRTYTGSRISFGASSFDRGTAARMVSPYSPQVSVSVHYDPADPTNAVLETKASGSKMFLIIGIVFAVIGLLSLCGGIIVFIASQGA